MKVGKLSLLAAGATVAALAFAGISRGAVEPITSWFLRSEAELLSLRRLLREPGPWAEIESLSKHMHLWTVSSQTVLTGPGETCLPLGGNGEGSEKGLHRFEFASRKGMSSRVYRLDFTSCRTGPGEYVFALERSGFGSNFQLGREPLAPGTAPLRILRLALEDPVVSQELIDTLREKNLASCQVVAGTAPPADYIFRAAGATPEAPDARVILEYSVEYDPVADRAVFERILR